MRIKKKLCQLNSHFDNKEGTEIITHNEFIYSHHKKVLFSYVDSQSLLMEFPAPLDPNPSPNLNSNSEITMEMTFPFDL